MVNVSRMDAEDNTLSSFMEVSQMGVPDDDGFIPVVHCSATRQGSSSVRSFQISMTQDSLTIQQAILSAGVQNRNSLELESKFDMLDKAENFDWYLSKLRTRLEHAAWEGLLQGGEPYVTTEANKALSNKLHQRITGSMSADVAAVTGAANTALVGLGLELLQATIDHFIPTSAVNLPFIFKEWHELSQKKDELVTVFSARVSKLTLQSKSAGQEYTGVSQILTLVEGLHEGFEDFRKDYFSGCINLASTTLRDTTALAKTLDMSMPKRRQDAAPPSRRGRTRCAAGNTPDNEAVDVVSGPLSRSQVDSLFANFKCPLHRVDNHRCLDCFPLKDAGFIVTKLPAGTGRRVGGPTTASTEVTPEATPVEAVDTAPTQPASTPTMTPPTTAPPAQAGPPAEGTAQ
jgi:hypothetical protein